MSVSPVIQSLTSRLLLSRGGVPEGKPDDVSFVRLRVERLLAMGDVGNALGLIDVIPAERRDESLARVETDALFLDGRRAEACGKVEVSVARYQDIYWRQAQAFCLALAGAHARAALIADLLRERSVDVSPVFFAAIERLGGGRNVDAKPPPAPDGLGLSMMLAAGMPPPASFLKTAQPAALRSIALSSGAEPALRLEAAERAQAVGALTEDEVMRLFLGFPFTEVEVANPLTAAESAWGPRARALLIRAAASQPVSLGKADVLRSAWQLGTERGGHDEVRRASVPVVAGMPVDSTLSEFAGAASRMLFAAGRLDEALAWYRVVAADAARSPETQRAAESLWPLALLAGDGEFGGRATGGLQGWYDDLRQRDPQHAQRKALALFSVLEASGRDVPETLWQSLLGAPMVSLAPALNMAWAESLDDASRNRRVGEVVLLVVSGAAAVGDRTFPSDSESVRAIRALREVGLEADARRLAVETAIAAGI